MTKGGRRATVMGVVAALLLLGAGYGYADVRGVVPGPLTTSPPAQDYPELRPAPGAAAPAAPSTSGVATVPGALDPDAPLPTEPGLTAAFGPALADPALGPAVSASVVDVASGRLLFQTDPGLRGEPASVAKVLTAAAALRTLGPATTLTTSTRMLPGDGDPTATTTTPPTLFLVGTGDLLLAAGHGDPTAVLGRAGLADLAAQTAAGLRADGTTRVRVRLDDSALGGLGWGEATGPGVGQADISSGFVAPLTGLAVDVGRTSEQNYAPRVADPGLDAAGTFVAALQAEGITVDGQPARERAPAAAAQVAAVESAPIAQVVGFMLDHSDNTVADTLSRLVAVRTGGAPTFAGGGSAVLTEIRALGVDTSGCVLTDGSGLSDGSQLSAQALAQVIAIAGSPDHPELRPLLEGLPVGGLTGTLTDRFGPRSGAQAGVGTVRAKTGTLSRVSSLAGIVVTRDGRLLSFAVIADQVPATEPGRAALDRAAVALLGCGCR